MPDHIPLSQPDITETEIDSVVATLRSGRLSIGPRLEEFERLVAARAGRAHGVGVSSGTCGLHLALLALGVEPGDEVITPAFSFVASANCVLYVGATPVFADCDPCSLNVAGHELERLITDRTKAVIGVEVFGNPSGMDELAAVCKRHELPLIEDACEGLGGRLGRQRVGGFGRVAVFGFYPNKQITTGEGGMIVTDDDRIADCCRSLRNQGRAAGLEPGGPGLGSWLAHERLGYNFRLSELNAALGVAQMQRLDEILSRRQHVASLYTRRLMGCPDLIVPTVEPDVFMSWFVYVVRLANQYTRDDRDAIIAGLRRHEIGASDYFPPIPLMPFYRESFGFKPGDFPVAESVSQRTIALPFSTRLAERDVEIITQTLEVMIARTSFARQ